MQILSFLPRCGLPVCGSVCAASEIHKPECDLLTLCRAKLKRAGSGEVDTVVAVNTLPDWLQAVWRTQLPGLTASVTTLRLLSLQWRDKAAWALLAGMQDQAVNPAVWEQLLATHRAVLHLVINCHRNRNPGKGLKVVSQDPRVGEAELRKVCGVQQTNGAQLHLSPGHGRGLAVYLVQVPPQY